METLTYEIANEYRQRAMRLPSNGLQDAGKRMELRKELQVRCNLTELQAVNIINGHYIGDYVRIEELKVQKRFRKEQETAMRVEKNGFVLCLEGKRMEISNKYGVWESGDVAVDAEDILEGFAEEKLDDFIEKHSVVWRSNHTCIKKVAFDEKIKEYIQLQAVLPVGAEYWLVQKFDNELMYMGEEWSGCKYRDDVTDWMRSNFDIESCLPAEVFRSALGDCTNGGISAQARNLYILAETKGPFEPEDIRQCVYIEWREVCGEEYIDCKPAYGRNRWYMEGGNFLYSSDSRFKKITKSKYPISIHDRYEGE